MSKIKFGYSDFLKVLNEKPELAQGIVVDTNVLISASYDSDAFFDATQDFLELIIEKQIPIFCNVNVRSEFLEIHRRIIFTEALLDFWRDIPAGKLPMDLASQFGKLSKRNDNLKAAGKQPLRLSEPELKDIKFDLNQISDGKRTLWSSLCEDRVGNKLEFAWNTVESELGLNFLTTREEDKNSLLVKPPMWGDAVKMIEKYGVSSADAMIVNIFNCSALHALVTSDREMCQLVEHTSQNEKICFVPDQLLT